MGGSLVYLSRVLTECVLGRGRRRAIWEVAEYARPIKKKCEDLRMLEAFYPFDDGDMDALFPVGTDSVGTRRDH
jgi:hypothetical protein